MNPQCQHHDRSDQPLLEYQEISAHIQEATFSVHQVEFDPGCDSFLSRSFKMSEFRSFEQVG